MKKVYILGSAMALFGLPTGAMAGGLALDIESQYVFRGIQLADFAVQPSAEYDVGNLSVGAWGSFPVEDSHLYSDEIDFYASYGWQVKEDITASFGATYYHYPGAGGDTFELGLTADFDKAVPFNVSIYRDLDLDTTSLIGGLEHGWDLGNDLSVSFGSELGGVWSDDSDEYQYLGLSLNLNYDLSDNASSHIGVRGAYATEDFLDNDDNGIWFGVGVATGF